VFTSVTQSTMLRLPSCQKLWERRESLIVLRETINGILL